MYPKDDPKWVKATTVKQASLDGHYVDVTAYGETFRNCRAEWSDPFLNKAKSDVLVQNDQGDWLRVWFYDKDIEPATPGSPRRGASSEWPGESPKGR